MKFFLTGESGILGSAIKSQLLNDGHEVKGFSSLNIQLWNYSDVSKKVNDFKPDVVIHCAAMTDVDRCEDERDTAILTNIIGSQNIARAADKANAKIIYISSCGIYGNTTNLPHTEYDKTLPLNFHHFTKLEGEIRVKEQARDFLIIRPGWLFGGNLAHKKNFVEARRKESLAKPVIQCVTDKYGSPTYTVDVAKQIIYLLKEDLTGTFNVVNEGCASRFDYIAEIIRLFKIDTIVEPIQSTAFIRRAIMPDNECLANMNLTLLNKNIMPDWKTSLRDYIDKTYRS